MTPKRYSIHLADLDPTQGAEINKARPVVVVSRDVLNAALQTVVVCPLTTQLHARWRSRVRVVCAGKKAEIAVDQIRTISKARLLKEVDQLSPSRAAELRAVIAEMYAEP
jgi:mRNA interferase MazF